VKEEKAVALINKYAVKYADNPSRLNFEIGCLLVDFLDEAGYSFLAMAVDDKLSTEAIDLTGDEEAA
jgi:hypothetical protein